MARPPPPPFRAGRCDESDRGSAWSPIGSPIAPSPSLAATPLHEVDDALGGRVDLFGREPRGPELALDHPPHLLLNVVFCHPIDDGDLRLELFLQDAGQLLLRLVYARVV